MATLGTGGGLGGPKSSGGVVGYFPPPMNSFLLPRLSFGHKNILREGMRVIFDITLLIIVLSPHPTIRFLFCAKYGSLTTQNMQQISLGGFFEWETAVYFCPLFVHFKSLLTTLTNSALILRVQQLSHNGAYPHPQTSLLEQISIPEYICSPQSSPRNGS